MILMLALFAEGQGQAPRPGLIEGPTDVLTLSSPVWAERPGGWAVRRSYPAEAKRKKAIGGAVISCKLSADGRLTGCAVDSETPRDAGFGEAMLRLGGRFRMDVTHPAFAEGRVVRVEVFWNEPGSRLRTSDAWRSPSHSVVRPGPATK